MINAKVFSNIPALMPERSVLMFVDLPGWISVRLRMSISTHPTIVCDFEEYSSALQFSQKLACKRGYDLIDSVPDKLRV